MRRDSSSPIKSVRFGSSPATEPNPDQVESILFKSQMSDVRGCHCQMGGNPSNNGKLRTELAHDADT